MSDIIIYGRGKTGKSLMQLVARKGFSAEYYDDERGFDCSKGFSKSQLVLLSPGVKPDAKGVADAKKAGAKIMSELEYCFPLCKGRCVSVTGTNGKTTTCEMIYGILREHGYPTRLLGNGGIPFSYEVCDVKADEIVVLESSSFQLSGCVAFAPFVSVFTNLACDHLDYHKTLEEYEKAKLNNFIRQKKGYAIFNADDANVVKYSRLCKCNKLFYSVNDNRTNCYFDGENAVVNMGGVKVIVATDYFKTLLRHNLSNALASVLACACVGVAPKFAVEELEKYEFLPHRMQTVAVIDNVKFVDDSKGTNVHATLGALSCFDENIALILGGSDKGESFDAIFANAKSNLKKVIAVGATAYNIKQSGYKFGFDVQIANDIKTAVHLCYEFMKRNGGVVLMSNACASFDRFASYAERGDYFQKAVNELNGRK